MDAPPSFQAVLVPHRSLSPSGLRALACVICGGCGLTATGCLAAGAWPVAGFAVLVMVLATLLLRLNVRAARATEVLTLDATGLRILRIDRFGRRRESSLPAAWLAVELQDRAGRVPALLLSARGRREEVGASLGEAQKRDLAETLRALLDASRHPSFDNPQLRDGA